MTDSKWWNTYFALQGGTEGAQTVTAIPLPAACIAGIQADLELEQYWMRRYFEMTGYNGRWICTRGPFDQVVRFIGCFLTWVAILVGCALGLAASAVLVVVEVLLPFLPGLAILAVLAIVIFFLIQFLWFVIVVLFQFVLSVYPDVIQFFAPFVQLVISFVSTIIHDIVNFVSRLFGAASGGL